MKNLLFLLIMMVLVLIPVLSFGATVPIKWDASSGATGYRIEQCLADPAVGPWTLLKDVPGGTVLNTTVTLPDTGTVHLRIAPYNANGPLPRTNAGVWFNNTLSLPGQGAGFTIP